MNDIKVIKRDGSEQNFDISKIKRQIEFACKDTNINPIELESHISLNLNRKKLTTKDIQETLINTAKTLIDLDKPQMNLVTGRLLQWQIYREVYKNTKIDKENWREHIEYLIRNGYYKKEILDKLNKFNIEIINIDFEKNYSQVLTDATKYLIKNKKGYVEYPYLMDLANALLLSKTQEEFENIYFLLANQYISLATPFQRNLRRPNGNLGSCFIGSTKDNILSISKSWQDISLISKEGGGIGWWLGYIRPSNTRGRNVIKSKHINYWIKILNDIIITVDQSGVSQGALTVALPWWHMDIEDFVYIKATLKGDLRLKAFDIFPQIVVDNYFLEKVKNKEEIYLFNHYQFKEKTGIEINELGPDEYYNAIKLAQEMVNNGKIEGIKIKANQLWKEILQNWIRIGDMYITHFENLNKSNYVKIKHYVLYKNKKYNLFDKIEDKYAFEIGEVKTEGLGITHCGNLCVESFSIEKPSSKWNYKVEDEKLTIIEDDGIYHSCNLVSINVKNFAKSEKYLKETCEYAVKILDRSIELTKVPVKAAENGSKLLRNIGIGILGLADYLAWNKVKYDSEEGRKLAEKLMEKIAYYCYKTSIELAKELGSYPGIKYANYDKLFGEDPIKLTQESPNEFNWVKIQEDIKKYGIRNFYLLAIAPNTRTGLRLGVTASILPPQDKMFYQTTGDMSIPVLPPFIEERFWYYKGKFQTNPKDIIKMVVTLQKWVDTGISMEVPINPELITAKELSDEIIENMLDGKLKAVYYSQTINKEKDEHKECVSCAN